MAALKPTYELEAAFLELEELLLDPLPPVSGDCELASQLTLPLMT